MDPRLDHHEGLGERLLALDVRRRKVGFVVMEHSSRLIDWGVRMYRRRGSNLISPVRRLNSLLDCYDPGIVIIRPTTGPRLETRRMVRRIVRRFCQILGKRSVTVKTVDTEKIRRIFIQHRCHNKHQINVLLVHWFKELTWLQPAKRRPWQPENYAQTIFDAAAAAVTFTLIESGADNM